MNLLAIDVGSLILWCNEYTEGSVEKYGVRETGKYTLKLKKITILGRSWTSGIRKLLNSSKVWYKGVPSNRFNIGYYNLVWLDIALYMQHQLKTVLWIRGVRALPEITIPKHEWVPACFPFESELQPISITTQIIYLQRHMYQGSLLITNNMWKYPKYTFGRLNSLHK